MAAFFLACALSYTRAQEVPARASAGDEAAAVAEAKGLRASRAPGAKARLRALLADERDGAARARLTSILGEMEAKRLEAADFDVPLADADPQVRLAAVAALGKLGGPAAESRLVALLAGDPASGVRMSAAFWLGQTSHRGAAAALGQALVKDPDANVRVAAAQALARMGGSAARRELKKGSTDADERVRAWAK